MNSALVLVLGCGSLLFAQVKPTETERSLALQVAGNGMPENAQITAGLVQALRDLGAAERDPVQSVRILQIALAAAQRGGFREMEASTYGQLAHVWSSQADYAAAAESLGHALDLYRQAGSPPTLIQGVLASRSVARYHLADLDGALDDAQQSLAMAREIKDAVRIARVLNGMGNLYKDLGDYRQALTAFQEGLTIAEQKGEKLGEAFVLNNIGTVYHGQGDYSLAAEYTLRSLKIKESLGKKDEVVSSLINLGDDYDLAGRRAQARETLEHALKLARETGQKSRVAQTLKVFGRLEFEQGRYQSALARLEESRAIFAETGERLPEADALTVVARARRARREYSEAAAAALRARDLAREISGTAELMEASLRLGQAYRAMGRSAEARAPLAEAVAALEEMRDRVGGGESERELYLAGRTEVYRELLTLEMEEGRTESALRLAEQAKGRVLLDLLRGGHPPLDRVMSAAERADEARLRGRLAALHAQRERAGSRELDNSIDKARLDLSAFRSALYAAHPELQVARGDVQPIPLDRIGPLLPNRTTALLEYVVTPVRTYLFAIVRGAAGPILRVHAIPVSAKTLKVEAARFREQIATRDPGFADTARKLDGWLLEPARKELAGKTALIVVPDGELWHMPFQALQNPAGRFLLEDAAIAYAPSLSVLDALLHARRGATATSRTLLVLGNPAQDAPEAGREADAVAALYGAAKSSLWRGAAATREVFLSKAGAFDVLHLAAHGIFDDRNPMGSHIILAAPASGPAQQGWLEAGDVRDLDLKAALVVLSGCETARGRFENGEGSIGLSWAFLAAGARASVASQWRVESASTSKLMVAFHSELLKGAGQAEALRRAALNLLATERFHHPFYWAGFVLLGEGS